MAMLTAKSRYLIDRARRAIALSHALVPQARREGPELI
jgi:hypothetical protein